MPVFVRDFPHMTAWGQTQNALFVLLQLKHLKSRHTTLYRPPPILYAVISLLLSSFSLIYLSPLFSKNQTKGATTASGPGSGVTIGRRDQGVSKEHSSHSDLAPSPPPPPPPPPTPPLPPPHLPPPVPPGQGRDAAATSKNHQEKVGKGDFTDQCLTTVMNVCMHVCVTGLPPSHKASHECVECVFVLLHIELRLVGQDVACWHI